jgi:pimeloyl-ACP methyl ester carboxylesterase
MDREHGHPIASTPVLIRVGAVQLAGDLWLPAAPDGVIVFAHGSGSSRTSPRNRTVAAELVGAGFETLLFDLLTGDEERLDRISRHLRFDIELLSDRLAGVIEQVHRDDRLHALPVGLFGASTGAAAALVAATETHVDAVVSRGGRPDLAGAALERVTCPSLFIVGSADPEVLELNRRAMRRMTAPTSLHIVKNAGHLFEEPGALAEVTTVATDWFRRTLPRTATNELHLG